MRGLLIVCTLIVAVMVWLIMFPGDYEPPPRELKDESAYNLDEKAGWYLFEDSTQWLITYGAENGMTINRFGEMDRGYLTPVDRGRWKWRERSTDQINSITFNYDSTSVSGFEWQGDQGKPGTASKVIGPYNVREVSYLNKEIEIYNTMMVPNSEGPWNAMIVIHGSGVSNRDNWWYLHIVDYLAKNGILVLFPDKRGCGKSTGEWHTAKFEDFVDDARAGAQYLKNEFGPDINNLGILGISQGGKISALTINEFNDFDFAINLSGSVVTLDEALTHEVSLDIRNSGLPEIFVSILEPIFSERAKNKKKRFWDHNGPFDIPSTWRDLSKPAFILYGRLDEYDNVPVGKCEELIEEFNNPNITLKIYPDSGHALQDPKSGDLWMRQEALELVIEWINNLSDS